MGGFKFYERKEVKDALAYLKFLLNPDDSVSLRRIINEPKRGIGQTSLSHLESYARSQGISLWEAARRAEEVPNLSTSASRKISEFARLMEGLGREMERMSLPEFLQAVLERSGYLEAMAREDSFEAQGRLENLEELRNAAMEFSAANPGAGVEEFLERVSLVAEIDLYDEEEGAVTLMTLHNAKGLEFPVVFMVGMEDGVLPHLRCMGSMESMQEERRLFYVGVTRARDLLYLTGAVYRSQYGNLRMGPESRFIRDIPPQYLEVVSSQRPDMRVTPRDEREARRLDMLAASFKVGDRVRHEKWGEGLVTALSNSRSGPEITVNFPGKGEKLLLLEYAPISKLNGG